MPGEFQNAMRVSKWAVGLIKMYPFALKMAVVWLCADFVLKNPFYSMLNSLTLFLNYFYRRKRITLHDPSLVRLRGYLGLLFCWCG